VTRLYDDPASVTDDMLSGFLHVLQAHDEGVAEQ
jgi:hypothetical protein